MIEKVIKGCPICGSDVKGDKQHRYYCKSCNVLFHKKHLALSREHVEMHTKRTMLKKIDRKILKKIQEETL